MPNKKSRFESFAIRAGQFDARHRLPIFTVAGILFMLAIAGMTHIRVGLEYITNFDQDSPVRLAYEKANALLGGANIFNVVIETGNRDAIKEPVNLQAIKNVQTWLDEQPEIGGTISIVNYIELLNSAFNDNDPAKRLIPDTKKEIGQLLFFGANDEIESLVDSRYQMANIIIRTTAVNSDELSALANKVTARLQQMPNHLQRPSRATRTDQRRSRQNNPRTTAKRICRTGDCLPGVNRHVSVL